MRILKRCTFAVYNFRRSESPEVEEFRMNLYEAKTPLLGKGGVAAPSRNIPVPLKGADGGSCEKIGIKRYSPPCITAHHCKEGWPSDSENIAKHPLIARPGWFSDESKRKTTPAASVFGGFAKFSLMTQPPLLAVVPCYVPHLLLDTGALKTTG